MPAHPSYPNPQLVEALCEIHLRRSAADPWRPSKPGAFFKAVQDTYPEIEPVTQQGVQFVVGPDSSTQSQPLPPRISFRMKHRERPLLLQISEQMFTINALRPYPGWAGVKSELRQVWPLVLEIIKPEAITRIGMRYINRVQRRTSTETPGYWLRECEFIPAALLKSGAGYQMRLQSSVARDGKVILTVAHDPSDMKELHGSMLFDIDRITERTLEPTWVQLDSVIENLHEEIWAIFDMAKEDNLGQLLRGKL